MKIYIQEPLISGIDAAKIFVLDEKGTNRYQISIDEKGRLKSTLLDPNNPIELDPFLEMPTEFFRNFVKAVTDYASKNNIKTENENMLQGKFTATEKHLEDMRKIVFKDYENTK